MTVNAVKAVATMYGCILVTGIVVFSGPEPRADSCFGHHTKTLLG